MKKEVLKLGFFPKAYFFNLNGHNLVIEKERHVVCVYATGENNRPILAAIPLCTPQYFKKSCFTIWAAEAQPDVVLISAADIRIVIDYGRKLCAINKNTQIYGSDSWGKNCSAPWSGELDKLF